MRRPPVFVTICLLALSCASGKPMAEPEPRPAKTTWIVAAVERVDFIATDIDSVRVSADIRIVNSGELGVALSSLDYAAISGELRLAGRMDLGSAWLEPGAGKVVTMVFELDAPPGDSALIPIRLDATLAFSPVDGSTTNVTVSFNGVFPRVMPPTLSIASIRILKDELINTRLGINLEVGNPNMFPLSFTSLDYRLYGEGRYWASGSMARSFAVPGGQTATASLFLTMNFTDMNRSLLDQVIRLAAINYRVIGAGRIETGLEFLPEFVLPFDLSGRTEVRK